MYAIRSYYEVRIAYDAGEADLQAKIKVRMQTGIERALELVETTSYNFV